MSITHILKKLVAKENLTEREAYDTVTSILRSECCDVEIAGFLTALATKKETVDEITGGVHAMRSAAVRIQSLHKNTLDTVGTGGDGGISFNVSTTVAFVAAGAGAIVAKHGNRASSGKSGSADCLEALGLNLNATPELMEEALNELGITFMFAPSFHKAMKYAAPVRKTLGVKTIFNLLGPLTNPAGASAQLIGVFDPTLTETFAEVLKKLGSRCALVVHGHDGMDEITLTTTSRCSELRDGLIRTYEIDPGMYFGHYCESAELEGGNARENAKITNGILTGEIKGPKRDIVLINSAASLIAANMAKDIGEGIKLSQESIDSGAAYAKLTTLIEFSNQ